MSNDIISLRGVCFTYRNCTQPALANINLTIKEGEFIVITGLTGAGKSTLLYTLNGLIPNIIKGTFSGQIHSFGVETTSRHPREFASKIGIVFQDFSTQVFSTDIEAELAFGPENLGLMPNEIRDRIEESLKLTGLTDLRKRQPHTLSGGQVQRLAIASLLSMRPRLLCFDEPTTDLDPRARNEFFRLLKLLRDKGHTVIIVEHQLDYLLDADRIIVMDTGHIIKDANVKDVVTDVDLWNKGFIQPPQLQRLFFTLGINRFIKDANEAAEILKGLGFCLSLEKSHLLRTRQLDASKDYSLLKIKAQNLYFRYDKTTIALYNSDFNVYEKEFVAIVGANGSGKTTLVKNLNGLLKSESGKVYLDGVDIRQMDLGWINKKIGFVFQNPDNQIFNETVEAEVSFGLKNLHTPVEKKENILEETLKTVGLFSIRDSDPFCLTKGKRQLVAVASILVSRPDVLILDEPTTGLDWKELNAVMDILKSLNSEGHTIIFITHSMELVCGYAHRVFVMNKGQYSLNGLTRSIFSREELLLEAGLDVPPLVNLSNKLGATLLNQDEFLFCLEKKS